MRAIILAAGMGTRLRPLTQENPKALVKINGEPIIERQIKFLKERDIDDIIIVTGYLKEKFEYLSKKYNVKLIHNQKYDIYNNIYSMYIVREYLKDAYVIESDVYMTKNYFNKDIKKSTYFAGIKQNFKNEWNVKFNNNNKINEINICSGNGYILSGISYWNKEEGIFIKNRLEEAIENKNFKKLFWDDTIIKSISSLNVFIEKIDSDFWFEIDSIADLKKVQNFIKGEYNNEGLKRGTPYKK